MSKRATATLALIALFVPLLFALPALAGDRKVEDYSETIKEFKVSVQPTTPSLAA